MMLKDIATRADKEFDKQKTKELTKSLLEELDELQNILYAQSKYAVLVVLQGMDASGKDGAIKNVFGQLNPQGVSVTSFKAPTEEELSHDFLWRVHRHAPAKGTIRVFNRSHYEDVLITRVHGWCDDEKAQQRFRAINDFEWLLQEHNNTIIMKYYLHISPEEQQERLAERMHNPRKFWKYNKKDSSEALLWDKYMQAYEDVFRECNVIPWQIIPSDQNWYKEYLLALAVVEKLRSLAMTYPSLPKD